jgi:glyoxylase-like metal-dependent hydrolase (beta-lactamase superfamily II)
VQVLVFWLGCIPVLAQSAPVSPPAPKALACPPLPVGLQRVDANLWLRPAQPEAASGWTEPALVWVDARQLWVVDPGPHRCAGQALRRELLTRWPGRAHRLINSHAHPANVLGNSAWPAGTPIYALAAVRGQMQARCPTCQAHARAQLGPQWLAGTHIVRPNRVLQPGQWLQLGGRRWQVQAHWQAHTEADLSLWQPESRTWFPAGLVAWDDVPDLSRGQLQAWLAALPPPTVQPPLRVLGATSPAAGRAHWQATWAYLDALATHVRQADATGADLQQVLNAPAPPQAQTAALRMRHQLNLQRAWQQAEDAALNPQPNQPTHADPPVPAAAASARPVTPQ